MEVNRKTQENMSEGQSKRPTSSIKKGTLLLIEKEKNEKEPSKWSEKPQEKMGRDFQGR